MIEPESLVSKALWFEDEDPHSSAFEAANSLSAQVAKISGLKPFPAVAQKVSEMVADPDCRIDELSALIRSDPAIAARLMRLANSAMFSLGKPATSLDQALIRLGTSTLYQMVTALSVMGLFPANSPMARHFRGHCVGVAVVARHLAKLKAWPGAGQVFLCGLMHDLGKLLLMQTQELDYASLDDEALLPRRVHPVERGQLGYDHAVLGGHVMQLWNLPDAISHAVAWHHQPRRAYDEGGDIALSVAFLTLADQLEPQLSADAEAPSQELLSIVEHNEALSITGVTCAEVEQAWTAMREERQLALSSF